jgi:uncharacterized membrane protein YhaH (DUF805 family)
MKLRSKHSRSRVPEAAGIVHHSFWNWMFGFEGRASRAQWWLGLVIMLCFAATGLAAGAIAASITISIRFPHLTGDLPLGFGMDDPRWRNSAEGLAVRGDLAMIMRTAWAATCLVLLWSSAALGVKRLHDRGTSGWRILALLTPVAAIAAAPPLLERADGLPGHEIMAGLWLACAAAMLWAVIQFGVLRGEKGANRYGGDPLKKSYPA